MAIGEFQVEVYQIKNTSEASMKAVKSAQTQLSGSQVDEIDKSEISSSYRMRHFH